MFEKVSPMHPDKIADRIAGALVDMAYAQQENPKIAVEVLIGHGECDIIAETSATLSPEDIRDTVTRISREPSLFIRYNEVPQDYQLAQNQEHGIRIGDNGIFRGVPVTDEQKELSGIARVLYDRYLSDGKYLIDGDRLTICQSKANENDLAEVFPSAVINPLGDWAGGIDVDTGATNRKLGSDMGDSITGGGLHGKDFSKADITLSVFAFSLAQKKQKPVEIMCSIGDKSFTCKIGNGTTREIAYPEAVEFARNYISNIGGFEAFAEWGLI